MNVPLRRAWTREEFFAWEGDGNRYEFDGTQPVAMVGGSIRHAQLIGNLHFALRSRLRTGPCRFLGPDAGLETVGRAVRYPDALVVCGRQEPGAYTVSDATVVFEVLSPGSGRMDRIVKVREYAAVPSLRRYVIVESRSVGLMVLQRDDAQGPWRTTTLDAEDVLHMPEIAASIPVAELYEDVEPAASR